MNKKNNIKNQKGFTLLEVVVSIAVIAGLFMLYTAVISNVSLSRTIKQKDIALKIASHEIEGLRAGGYDLLPVSGSFSDDNLSLLPSGEGALRVSDYIDDVKEVVVTVSWVNFLGKSQSLSLSTLILEEGGLK
ncbi:MAG: hypothetical protein A3D35_02620 [Candidatus Staskawiczbacteria bacterium RIFCSPHIGHO2_02_FULL_34_9]|uniref:Type II secretion system protein GspI C-terminal domain-containing protein n=1 Tax=Candidatus Staskawiczbacteria bacterium RIFCSPHIGHO2_02_FULL_34_9 TaxID=1802206 RepID=A0A1G2I2W0_9BACT|nr:MAG: hypothetical protein A3D35_02620 [Candidatus Staskawiczbacteria bacterium RIFCSPHIGHO2_02_FULL_34_9]